MYGTSFGLAHVSISNVYRSDKNKKYSVRNISSIDNIQEYDMILIVNFLSYNKSHSSYLSYKQSLNHITMQKDFNQLKVVVSKRSCNFMSQFQQKHAL